MAPREIIATCAVIKRNGKYLIAKRKGTDFKDKWEFPRGTQEPGETLEECLKRKLREELGIEAKVRYFFEEGSFENDDVRIRLLAYITDHLSGEFKLNYHDEIRWVYPNEFDDYDFAPADISIVRKLQGMQAA